MDFFPVFILLILAFLQFIVVFAIVKLTDARWGRVVVVTLAVLLLAYLIVNIENTETAKSEVSDGAGWFEQAALIARLYELNMQFEISSPSEKAKLRPELLRISHRVGSIWMPSCSGMPSAFIEKLKSIDNRPDAYGFEGRGAEQSNAGLVAYMIILENEDRAAAMKDILYRSASGLRSDFYGLMPELERVNEVLQKLARPGEKNSDKHQMTNSDFDHLSAYTLAVWRSHLGHYPLALKKLRIALGARWFDTGEVDVWSARNLPPAWWDRLWFGYVLYQTGHETQALREYRLAMGRNSTMAGMREAYKDYSSPIPHRSAR